MEAYKTTCQHCNYVRIWSGYKTGLGKTPEQLKQMRVDHTTCKNCGATDAVTELDHESPMGKMLDEQLETLFTTRRAADTDPSHPLNLYDSLVAGTR